MARREKSMVLDQEVKSHNADDKQAAAHPRDSSSCDPRSWGDMEFLVLFRVRTQTQVSKPLIRDLMKDGHEAGITEPNKPC